MKPQLPDPELMYRAVVEKHRRRMAGEDDPDDFDVVRSVRASRVARLSTAADNESFEDRVNGYFREILSYLKISWNASGAKILDEGRTRFLGGWQLGFQVDPSADRADRIVVMHPPNDRTVAFQILGADGKMVASGSFSVAASSKDAARVVESKFDGAGYNPY